MSAPESAVVAPVVAEEVKETEKIPTATEEPAKTESKAVREKNSC
jgi:hypothetical protein